MRNVIVYGASEELPRHTLVDQIAQELAFPHLNVSTFERPEDLLGLDHFSNIYILDEARGFSEVCVIDDPDHIHTGTLSKLGVYEPSMLLRLMHRLQSKSRITLIGVPSRGCKEEIKQQILDIVHRH